MSMNAGDQGRKEIEGTGEPVQSYACVCIYYTK